MADMYLDAGAGSRPGILGRAVNLTAAVLSLSLVAGLGFWGWELLMRDATGVPVVRALAGPMRIAPEDPGGELAENQGFAVNRIAAEADAVEPPDQVVLAPAPLHLTEEDKAAALLDPDFAEASDESPPGMPAAGGGLLPDPAELPVRSRSLPPAITPPGPAVVPAMLVEAAAMRATDLAVAEALAGSAEGAAELLMAMAEPKAPAADRPVRPAPRPVRLAAVAPTAEVPAVVDLDPAAIPSGMRLVQLGAFETAELARAGWAALEAEFGLYMVGKQRVVQAAETGGTPFWRLRAAGFDDLADARRFCSALVQRQAECIPVLQR